ncbi:hypothetical protein LJB42_002868 [Komagataella kurtzmanii]|nr:hypothetical protein LJB42_002868 [Komagataella kurtzmanii]
MEALDIRSKSYFIKWVEAPAKSVLHWEIKPLKKSIDFGIYSCKKGESSHETKNNSASSFNTESPIFRASIPPIIDEGDQFNPSSGSAVLPLERNPSLKESSNATGTGRRRSDSNISAISSTNSLSLEQRLKQSNLKKEQWVGKCQGNELIQGTFQVQDSCLLAFVFDNTFSKTTAKKVFFNQYVEDPSIPKMDLDSTIYRNNNKTNSTLSLKKIDTSSSTGVRFDLPNDHDKKIDNSTVLHVKGGRYLQGFLLKKSRKGRQKSFHKRFFVLNFKYGILNYFANDNSKQVRGNMLIRSAAIFADEKTKVIILDSGLELWVLKSSNENDWSTWIQAFNFLKGSSSLNEEAKPQITRVNTLDSTLPSFVDRDIFLKIHDNISALRSKSSNLVSVLDDQQTTQDSIRSSNRKNSFWKKFKREKDDVNGDQLSMSSFTSDPLSLAKDIKSRIDTLMSFMDNSKNLQSSQQISRSNTVTTGGASIFSQEFYDAQEYLQEITGEVVFLNEQNDTTISTNGHGHVALPLKNIEEIATDSSDYSSLEETEESLSSESSTERELVKSIMSQQDNLEINDLYPLGETENVIRRTDIPESASTPPSILSFIRKNVGKDLSNVAMPVTANEPLSMLQKYSEFVEYCDLINDALDSDKASGSRLMKIAAFATSYFSSLRVKERNSRKPFNPMLGETFELVREDLGIRLISEKVVHRPVILAINVDSKRWNLNYSPSPSQKIWGKNAEVAVEGVARLTDRITGDVYHWSLPNCLLKNLIAGEKYMEPTGSMAVKCSDGHKAVVAFKSGGVFSGRSEQLSITLTDSKNNIIGPKATGTWTESISWNGVNIWKVGPLVPSPNLKFGFTQFAACLNEITSLEEGKIPPTDSRYRPDLRMYENGDVDGAEDKKIELEEFQRARRKANEIANEEHQPSFFHKGKDDCWIPIQGENNYWERRKRSDWDDVLKLW